MDIKLKSTPTDKFKNLESLLIGILSIVVIECINIYFYCILRKNLII